MLTRPIVSLFRSLRKKNIRFYYTPPTPEENYKLLGERKYDFKSLQEFGKIQEQEFKKTQELIKLQESGIKEFNNQLTHQKKVIEKIYDNLQNIQLKSSFLQIFTLIHLSINFWIIIFKN